MSFKQFWNVHKFKIIVFGSLLCLFVMYINNSNNRGTWSCRYSYTPTPVSLPPRFQEPKPRYPSLSKGEIECRRVMESIFHRPFTKQRPHFLKNLVTNQPLEIDCCNLDLMLGVEYNGQQHYKFVKGMHTSQDAFRNQQYRDEMKRRLCSENGMYLIVVPYSIKHEDIRPFIMKQLRDVPHQHPSRRYIENIEDDPDTFN